LPRPKLETEVRDAVRNYLRVAETLPPEEAPLNTQAVAHQLGFNRKTLKKYGLDAEIAIASERQTSDGKISARESGRRSYIKKLGERNCEIDAMRRRCEALLVRVCLAEGNAQRLGIDPAELWKPLSVPDRRLPHTGKKCRAIG
jgi:hypothetical protein